LTGVIAMMVILEEVERRRERKTRLGKQCLFQLFFCNMKEH
jgi:hypothetical protein